MTTPEAAPRSYRSFGEQSLEYFIRDHTEVPEKTIDSPAAWLGEELRQDPSSWREAVCPEEIEELESALDRIEREGRALGEIAGAPLPALEKRAAAWRDALRAGRGVVVLTGLPVERWGEARSSRAYWLLGHLIGIPGTQNASHELLGHVVDYGEQAAQRLAEVGPLATERARALDRYDAIGNDPEVRLDMALAPGDVQLLSNHTVVHARTAYREHPDRKRHLLRLWLSLPDEAGPRRSSRRAPRGLPQ